MQQFRFVVVTNEVSLAMKVLSAKCEYLIQLSGAISCIGTYTIWVSRFRQRGKKFHLTICARCSFFIRKL